MLKVHRCTLQMPAWITVNATGGDRKAQAKGIRQAHGLHNSQYRQSVLIPSAAEEKLDLG